MRDYKANMIPGGTTPTINVSQYDNDYAVTVTLFEGKEIYTPPVGATIRVEGTKPDGHGFEYPCTYQGNVVTMPIYTQMTVVSGRFPIELVVYQSGLRVGSCNIIFAVEKAPLGEDTDISETVIPDIIDAAQSSAEAAAEAADAAATSAASVVDSATAAAASATQAAASATSASASATTASSAATNAVSARDAAIEAAGDAETSSNAAATSESNAAASATAAATSESNAAASATAAAASATQAAASATAAATSAASAETAKTAAMEAAQAAAQSAASLTVDTELSSTSTNPVQNKVIDATVTELKNDLDEKVSDLKSALIENEAVDVFSAISNKRVYYDTADQAYEFWGTTNSTVYTFVLEANTRYKLTASIAPLIYGFSNVAPPQNQILSSGASNASGSAAFESDGTYTYLFVQGKNSEAPARTIALVKETFKTGKIDTLAAEVESLGNNFFFSGNLFNKETVTQGKFVATNTGALRDYAGAFSSDFIPIEKGKTYSYAVAVDLYGSTAGARLPLYDAERNFTDYATGTLSNGIVTVTIPASSPAVYCRFSSYLVDIDSTMFVEGVYPSKYQGFGEKTLAEGFTLNSSQIAQMQRISGGILEGKKIAYNGDSIAESRLQSTSANNGGGYAKIIADLTGSTYANSAVSGGILASAVPSGTLPHSVINTLDNMPDDADLICFEGGINDYWRDVPLGDYSESDYSGTLDTTTVCGALESILRQATQKWVGKPICFVIVHKIKSTVYVANSAGWTFAQGREKMIGICKKYAIPFYDAFAESGLNAYNDIQNTNFLTSNSSGTPDGCHPNETGYKKYYVPQLIALFEAIMPRS